MKQLIVKRSKQVMKFFTPELFAQFNSSDADIADRADNAWQNAILQYQKHLKKMRSCFTGQAWQLSRLNLHDAEMVGIETTVNQQIPLAFITLLKDEHLVSLVYVLADSVVRTSATATFPFTKSYRHWLYDEVDVNDDALEHRILLSDGSTLKISFQSVVINRTTIRNSAKRKSMKSIA
ncbi:MAG: hypothetical protein U0796_11875 [Gemmatales bacterium]